LNHAELSGLRLTANLMGPARRLARAQRSAGSPSRTRL